MLQDASPRRRWPRSQRFALTDKGRDAEASYRSTIVSSRTQEGRASFDAARSTWAESFRLLPDDGLYLGEVVGGGGRRAQTRARRFRLRTKDGSEHQSTGNRTEYRRREQHPQMAQVRHVD